MLPVVQFFIYKNQNTYFRFLSRKIYQDFKNVIILLEFYSMQFYYVLLKYVAPDLTIRSPSPKGVYHTLCKPLP
jgi:hypothetical protein